MRKTGYAVLVAMLATLMVGMTAVGAAAGPKGIGKVPAGTSPSTVLDSPSIAIEAGGVQVVDQVFTFTNNEAVTVTRVNLTFPVGITVDGSTLDVTAGDPACNIDNIDSTASMNLVIVSGVSCGTGGKLVFTVDLTADALMMAGVYSVTVEYKADPPKRLKSATNMWQASGDEFITVTVPEV